MTKAEMVKGKKSTVQFIVVNKPVDTKLNYVADDMTVHSEKNYKDVLEHNTARRIKKKTENPELQKIEKENSFGD